MTPPDPFVLQPLVPPPPRRAASGQLRLPLPLRRVIGRLAAADIEHDWVYRGPATIYDMIEIAEAALREVSDPAAVLHARAAVVAIAAYIGGQKVRFPTPAAVQRLLRDRDLWRAFDGRNTRELADRYGLTERQVFNILRGQRRLEQARRRAARAPQGRD